MPNSSTANARTTSQEGNQNPSAGDSGKTFIQEEVNKLLAFDCQSVRHCSKTRIPCLSFLFAYAFLRGRVTLPNGRFYALPRAHEKSRPEGRLDSENQTSEHRTAERARIRLCREKPGLVAGANSSAFSFSINRCVSLSDDHDV